VWLGFCVESLEPSPKFQLHDVGLPVEVSVNCTAKGAWPELGLALKLAVTCVEAFVTVIVWLALLVWPPLPDTVNVAVKLPALV
jgi:hypothetical protein